jgi:DNA repair protein RecO (recombination protein O)
MRILQQPAFVLHNRPYSESSWIVEAFTRDYGRTALLAKGARRLKSRVRGILQPFQPLLLSWSGKGELPTLTNAEPLDSIVELRGRDLVCGFYCNELLMRLFHRYDPHQGLFDKYRDVVIELYHGDDSERALRIFEKALLRELGYAVVLDREAGTDRSINADDYYRYEPNTGPVVADRQAPGAVRGKVLLDIGADNYTDSVTMREAKILMRNVIRRLLGERRLISRDMFYPVTSHGETDKVTTL